MTKVVLNNEDASGKAFGCLKIGDYFTYNHSLYVKIPLLKVKEYDPSWGEVTIQERNVFRVHYFGLYPKTNYVRQVGFFKETTKVNMVKEVHVVLKYGA